ncbi:MAG TPA: alanine racemase [Salinivirga sp.]|uniref:alanine racemase n=1 Tax=Salinivirga sp. TaxID=1970192 RepID=UPI002B4A87FD|nr:alanine racemase [Salinivirga sp.]HKK58038.1 alanine racemase [Salinivirga sp.]
MLFTSYIELSKSALNNNIQFMKKMAGNGPRYSMVIKANAYGHGIEDLLPLVESCGIDHFSVFSVEEARRALKVKNDYCDLMIMGFVDDDHLEWAIENNISFFVFTKERLDAVCKIAKQTSLPARIHIELETGMHRTGFVKDDLEYVAQKLQENAGDIELEGLCTHFAGAESLSNFDRIYNQIGTFHRRCSWFHDKGLQPKYKHLSCSAGVLNFPEASMDLVRVGIANYGFWPNNETKILHIRNGQIPEDPLQQVLSWKSKVMSVNPVAEDEYVSYGTSYRTNRESKIATVPVGYGYGFSRNLSNMGHVLINEKRVPVVGAVNMNMMVVDVTDLPNVKVGDEVVMIGKQGDKSITISSFSDMNNSMNYELLTRLPAAIPRYEVD